jgi:O-antigen ligase
VALIAAGLIDGIPLLVYSLPLPAFFASADLRIAPSALLTLALVAGLFLARAPSREALHVPRGLTVPCFAFLTALIVSAVFAQNKAAAARELLNWVLHLGLLIGIVDLFVRRPSRIHATALAIAAILGLSGGAALLQSAGVLPSEFPMNGTPFFRATLGFGWPNELAMFMAMGLPFAMYAVQHARGPARALATVGLIASLLGLLATFSRGSWLALIAATALIALIGGRRVALGMLVAGAVCVLTIDAVAGGVLSQRAGSVVNDASLLQRGGLQLVGLLMFRAHPVVGVGPGGFADGLQTFGPQVAGLWDYVGTAHNVYVDMAAETGLLGLASFLWLLWAAARVVGRVGRGSPSPLGQALLWSFAVVVFVGFTAWPFAHGLGQLVMIVVASAVALDSTAGRARVA